MWARLSSLTNLRSLLQDLHHDPGLSLVCDFVADLFPRVFLVERKVEFVFVAADDCIEVFTSIVVRQVRGSVQHQSAAHWLLDAVAVLGFVFKKLEVFMHVVEVSDLVQIDLGCFSKIGQLRKLVCVQFRIQLIDDFGLDCRLKRNVRLVNE